MDHIRSVKDRYLLIGPVQAYVEMSEYLTKKFHCTQVCAYGDTAIHMANAFQPDIVLVSLHDAHKAEATVRGLQALPLGAMYTIVGMGGRIDGLSCAFDIVAPSDVTYFGLMRRLRRFEEDLKVRAPEHTEAPDEALMRCALAA